MGDEIFEETTELTLYAEAGQVSLGTFPVGQPDFVTPVTTGEGEPTEQEKEGYTGNAGMTIEYWYHYGAVAFWPRTAMDSLFGRLKPIEFVNWLPLYLRGWEDERLEAPRMVRKLLTQLVEDDGKLVRYGKPVVDFGAIAGAMVKLKEQAFFGEHGTELLAKGGPWIDAPTWRQLAETFGESAVSKALSSALSRVEREHLSRLLATVRKLKEAAPAGMFKTAWPAACAAVTRTRPTDFTFGDSLKDQYLPALSEFKLLCPPDGQDEAQQKLAQEVMMSRLNREYVHVVIPATIDLFGEHYLAEACRVAAIDWLQTATATVPVAPTDWAKPAPDIRHPIRKELTEFMRNPGLRIFEFRAVKQERSTLQRRIEMAELDLRLEALRQGSPHILRLTKVHAAYDRAIEEQKQDLALLERL